MKRLTFDLEEYFHLLDYTPPSDVELINSSLPYGELIELMYAMID